MRRDPWALVVIVLLGALGTETALMGYSIVLQNLACRCQAPPAWAWHLGPTVVIVGGIVLVECAAFLAAFPRLGFRGHVGVVAVVAAAVESAVVAGTSYHTTEFPNLQALAPLTAAVAVLVPLAIVALWEVDVRGRGVPGRSLAGGATSERRDRAFGYLALAAAFAAILIWQAALLVWPPADPVIIVLLIAPVLVGAVLVVVVELEGRRQHATTP